MGQLPGQALMWPRAQARLPGRAVADALSALAATGTLSGVVAAVGDAALEVSGAVAYVQGQARVALLHSVRAGQQVDPWVSRVLEGDGLGGPLGFEAGWNPE